MQISNNVDHLITKLTELKPELSTNSSSNQEKFNDLLTANITTSYKVTDDTVKTEVSKRAKQENIIPSWVDPDYGYDPQNPRKPNMRELIEAISGKNIEDLYSETNGNWQKISRTASEMLYGVVSGSEDTRDWLSIMSSEDIITKAREQTAAMYEPEVDIQSNFNNDGIMTEQIAVIKDNKSNILRSLTDGISAAEETLINFGATRISIPENLENRINPEKFDADLLAFLKNFDHSSTSLQQFVVHSASEIIANKISQEIPLDELAKL